MLVGRCEVGVQRLFVYGNTLPGDGPFVLRQHMRLNIMKASGGWNCTRGFLARHTPNDHNLRVGLLQESRMARYQPDAQARVYSTGPQRVGE